jgi:hypothetical protein
MRLAAVVLPIALLIASIVGGLAGCGNHAPGMESLALGGTATDGTGFLPLTGDQTLVPGAQGGFHVWLKYRARGMGGKVKVVRTARRVSDGRLLLAGQPMTQEIGAAGPDGTWELPDPVPTFLCPSPLGVRVVDELVRFEVQVLDENGVPLIESSAEATPRCPTGDQATFCERICTG